MKNIYMVFRIINKVKKIKEQDMEEKTSINFDKAVITPLEKRVDVTLELDAELIAYLEKLAEKTKQSIDNVVCHILSDMMAEHVDIATLNADSLRAAAAKSRRILIMEDDKPFARVTVLRGGNYERKHTD